MTLFLSQSRSILPKPIKGNDIFSLLIVNQADTMVLLTAFFMLTTWLEEKERRRHMQWHVNLFILAMWLQEIRRMQWQVNLSDIPEHALLQPMEHFPHVILGAA